LKLSKSIASSRLLGFSIYFPYLHAGIYL